MHASVLPIPLEAIDPLVHNVFSIPGSDVSFSASCFQGEDWTLKDMYEPQDVYRYPAFAARLGSAYFRLGARDVYGPTPVKFNGEVVLQSDLSTTIHLPHGVFLHRNKDIYADGTFLSRPGDSGTFSAGGCGMVDMVYNNDMIFAHGGRESIIDRLRVRTQGAEQGRNRDLIDNMLIRIGACEMERVHVWPLYFIKPKDFVHHKDDPNPDHAAYNRGAMEYLPREFPSEFGTVDANSISIDLPRIVRAQCIKRGIPARNVHMGHAYLADDLPTTRKADGKGRYLVTSVRLA